MSILEKNGDFFNKQQEKELTELIDMVYDRIGDLLEKSEEARQLYKQIKEFQLSADNTMTDEHIKTQLAALVVLKRINCDLLESKND